ncbi:glycoside hydrolase family 25 protein [Sinorhizobium fredii]|uniref:glycoside hydrolase family 25 protein n=1 Tax=Rhizobium fredii TaxID=380 RepID=UPI0004B68BE8|nr:glycoside hydrolase family 25 protein [Sinorhizobium fredii]
MSSKTLIIDLSHHNPEPDWPALRAGGILGVIMKASEGTTFVDATYQPRKQKALAAGLATASYHFFHGNSASEMAHYLSVANPALGERVVLDHEAEATLDQLVEAVKYLRESRPDLQVTIYSGHTIKDQLGSAKNDYLAQNTSLWIAHYTEEAKPSWPKETWPAWSLWQYTDHALVAGCSAPVDGNRWNGTEDNLLRWLGPMQPAPGPEPPAEPLTVFVTIQKPKGVDVKVMVEEPEE